MASASVGRTPTARAGRRRATLPRRGPPYAPLAASPGSTTSAPSGPSASTSAQRRGEPGHALDWRSSSRRADRRRPSSAGRPAPVRSPRRARPTPAPAQHGQRRRVGDQIERVLPVAQRPTAPSRRPWPSASRRHRRIGADVEQVARPSGHGRVAVDGSGSAPGGTCRIDREHVAVIDVAGFVADLKSHADRPRLPRARRAPLRRDLLAAPVVGGRPAPRGGLQRPDRPAPLAGGRPAGPARLRGRGRSSSTTPTPTRPTASHFPLLFTWTLPPLPHPPDLLVLATELAGVGGVDLPVEVSAIDSFASVTDAPERSLSIVARIPVELAEVYLGDEEALLRHARPLQGRQPVPARARRRWLGED